MLISCLLLFFLLLFDQLTKYLTELFLNGPVVKELIPYVLSVTKVYNTGAAWSSFDGATVFLAIISLIASLVFVYFFTKNNWKRKKCYSIAITCMLAGTYGNFIDRFFASFFPEYRPGVVDMIIFTPLDTLWEKIIGSSFPIFNVADVCLVIGVIFLVIDILFFQERRAVK